MSALLLITGVILFLTALGLVYRVFTLVSIAKDRKDKHVGLSNKVNAALFPIVFVLGFGAMFYYSGEYSEYFLPEAASEHGVRTDQMFWISMAVISFAFFATNLLLFLFPFQYQYKEGKKAKFYPDNHNLEIVWTVIPAITMAGLVIFGYFEWDEMTMNQPEDAIEIEIMGKQFNWQVRYPGADGKLGKYNYMKIDGTNSMGVDFNDPASMDDFMPGTLHLPKGKNVVLKIRSRDVLHSVFLPHFRVKMDAVPGMPTSFYFKPTKSTQDMREELSKDPLWAELDEKGKPKWQSFNYELACTEICGNSHFAMKLRVVVDEEEDFNTWFANQKPWAQNNADYVKEKYAIDVKSLGDKVVAGK
ncbi:MAG: cytochrome c oxidase subunit II [Flammeovirgaceae bacterium]